MKFIRKKIFNLIFGASSSSVKKRISFLKTNLKRGGYHSINQLDKKLEKYVDYDNGFYVELGANDGVEQSNSLFFELKRNWRGILIEPSPYNFILCREQRSNQNHIFCNACVGFDYKDKYVDMKYANLMSISENLNLDLNDKEAHIKSGKNYLKETETVFSFGAIAATLDSLLKSAKAPKIIDFISIDVEGAELEVLKGINFEHYSFKYMLIEIRNFKPIEDFLIGQGYVLEKQLSAHDYLFKSV